MTEGDNREESSKRMTVWFPGSIREWIDKQGTTSDSFSAYVRNACRTQQEIDIAVEEFDGDLQDDWVEDAIAEYLDRQRAEREEDNESETVGAKADD